MSIPSPDPRHAPPKPAAEAPVHILGLKGASVVIVDDQDEGRRGRGRRRETCIHRDIIAAAARP